MAALQTLTSSHARRLCLGTRPRTGLHQWLRVCVCPLTLFLAGLARVLVLILVLGLLLGLVQGLVDLVARLWAWQRWLHLSRLTRWSHIAAGLATLSLAAFTQFALPSPDAIVSFEADMLCPVVWLLQLQGLMPLALPLWALGLWRDHWRQRDRHGPSAGRSPARSCSACCPGFIGIQ